MADAAPAHAAPPAAPAVDPIALAERVLARKSPRSEALRVPTDGVVAMARRLVALHRIASDATALLATLDALDDARAIAGTALLTQRALGLTERLAGALIALGYDTTAKENTDGGEEDEDAGGEPASAAE